MIIILGGYVFVEASAMSGLVVKKESDFLAKANEDSDGENIPSKIYESKH